MRQNMQSTCTSEDAFADTQWGKDAHTVPERCQPEKFATPSFSAFLVVCDQDKKLQVGQQIL